MNIKKLKIIMLIVTFFLAFPFHFVYDKLPNFIFSIFFSVNESIWEHMKLLYTTIIFSGIIEYIIIKRKHIEVNNFLLSIFISALLSIPIYLLMFLPIYYRIGENFIVAITIMFITIAISEIISYYILKTDNIRYSNIISLLFIIFSYIIFGYLTYNPIEIPLFFDPMEEKYGINHFILLMQKHLLHFYLKFDVLHKSFLVYL